MAEGIVVDEGIEVLSCVVQVDFHDGFCVVVLLEVLEHGDAVGVVFEFGFDGGAGDSLEEDVVAAIGEYVVSEDVADADGVVDDGVFGVVGFPGGVVEGGHGNELVASECVGDHVAVAGFEDVESDGGVWEQYAASEGEEGDGLLVVDVARFGHA